MLDPLPLTGALLIQGDCLEILRSAPDNSIDAMVTDPPAGISFMGKKWDADRGGRVAWVSWLSSIMEQALRVLKPGAYALVWAIPRTSHWTATALEDAGFEIRDIVHHHFATGMPKNRMLKPATEHWILARKPLGEKNLSLNAIRWGTGLLNIEKCQILRASQDIPGWHKTGAQGSQGYQGTDTFKIRDMSAEEIQERRGDKGRWPANLILSHHPDCVRLGNRKIPGSRDAVIPPSKATWEERGRRAREGHTIRGFGDESRMETVEVWECVAGCPVAELDRQSGQSRSGKPRADRGKGGYWAPGNGIPCGPQYGDFGGASRFFYVPKPSRSEKERGCEGLPTRLMKRVNPGGLENDPKWAPVEVRNHHVTVKPVTLMRYFCRLVTPSGGIVVDPFMGSGSTGIGAIQEGLRFVGIEIDADYFAVARARVLHALNRHD